ncbi:MAG: hypothetical protein AAB152_17965 [Candidatus Coatesbacteria bacterium]
MKKVLCLGIPAMLMGITLAGCSQRIIDFTVISSKNINLPVARGSSRVTGEDCKIFGRPELKGAVDRAIESAGTDYDGLVDGVLYFKTGFLGLMHCYTVEGTPINSKKPQ